MTAPTVRSLVPWLREAVRTAPGLLGAYRPGAPLDPRLRERILVTMAEIEAAPLARWVHQSWLDFLGERPTAEGDDEAVAVAERCASDDRPALGESPVVRAIVARGAIDDAVDQAASDLLGAVTGRVPVSGALVFESLLLAAAAPVAVPTLMSVGALSLVSRWAPPMPAVEPPKEEANLLAHLLVRAAPSILANAAVRTIALRLPRMVDIGMRSGRTTATLRVGQGRVAVENVITKDAVVVIEGDVEPLLRHASGSIVRELRSLRLRPG